MMTELDALFSESTCHVRKRWGGFRQIFALEAGHTVREQINHLGAIFPGDHHPPKLLDRQELGRVLDVHPKSLPRIAQSRETAYNYTCNSLP